MAITDVNRDGIVQLAEITLGGDIIVLATRRSRVAVCDFGSGGGRGLAAALSTADGLLLAIAMRCRMTCY